MIKRTSATAKGKFESKQVFYQPLNTDFHLYDYLMTVGKIFPTKQIIFKNKLRYK